MLHRARAAGLSLMLVSLPLAACSSLSTAPETSQTATTGTVPLPASTAEQFTTVAVTAVEPQGPSDCKRAHLRFLTALGMVNGSPEQQTSIDDELRAMADQLPAVYANDARLLANAYEEFTDAVAIHDGNLSVATTDAALEAALQAPSTGDALAAYESVSGYFEENCPIADTE
jgi:hypothetical protein